MNLNAWEKEFNLLRRSAITPNARSANTPAEKPTPSPRGQQSAVAVKCIRSLNEKVNDLALENQELREHLRQYKHQQQKDSTQISELQEALYKYKYQTKLTESNRDSFFVENRQIRDLQLTNEKLNDRIYQQQREIDVLKQEIIRLKQTSFSKSIFDENRNRIKVSRRYLE